MSLFPLTSSSVLDLDKASFYRNSERHSKSSGPKLGNGSYIQHTSAPTTPGILSPTPSTYFTPVSSSAHTQRSGSSTPRIARSRRNSNHNLAHGQHESYISDLPKSKSTTQLYGDSHASNVWMHRTGAALSSESREFKGQSWLVYVYYARWQKISYHAARLIQDLVHQMVAILHLVNFLLLLNMWY
ncbi:hypothetical protein EV426DRAFT_2551 [Tirmania nivea]|nr:hypothetical protein EV426DRAFT_2551 [Tirmania nivea]